MGNTADEYLLLYTIVLDLYNYELDNRKFVYKIQLQNSVYVGPLDPNQDKSSPVLVRVTSDKHLDKSPLLRRCQHNLHRQGLYVENMFLLLVFVRGPAVGAKALMLIYLNTQLVFGTGNAFILDLCGTTYRLVYNDHAVSLFFFLFYISILLFYLLTFYIENIKI